MGPSAKSDRALFHFLPTVPSFKEGRRHYVACRVNRSP